MRRLASHVFTLALLSCTSGTVSLDEVGDHSGTTDGNAALATTTDAGQSGASQTPPAMSPPQILSAPNAVARGGRMYVTSDTRPGQLVLDIDGYALGEATHVLQAELATGLYRIPESIPLGEATLSARRVDEPTSVATHALLVTERRFVDIAAEVGLGIVHDATDSPPECAESHTGLAFADYDGDNNTDLFLGHVGRGGLLMRHMGPGSNGLPHFEDVTAAAGLGGIDQVSMATFIDLDGDGDKDLFVGRRGQNRVYRNRMVPEGVSSFIDITDQLGLGVENQRTMGVAFGDYDGDDDLDLYVVNHAFCFPDPSSDVRAGDHLYENVGGVFVERTEQITGPATDTVGFSAAWLDADGDGDVDLVVANDAVGGPFGQPNALWRNDGADPAGGWRFTDHSIPSGVAIGGANAMGLALGDVDRDGAIDLAFTNIGGNYLMLGGGDGTFVDVSEAAGMKRGRLPWGQVSTTWAVHMLDHDNDGDLDLYFSGGRIKGSTAIPDALLDGNVADTIPTFSDVTWTSGMADPGHGKASVLVDLDRDGALDIVTTAWGETLSVYHNRAVPPEHHWLAVDLVGRGGNREAVGATVTVTAGPHTQSCVYGNRPSLGGGGEPTCHFGLGQATSIETLHVIWPGGQSDSPPPPAVDQRIVVTQSP